MAVKFLRTVGEILKTTREKKNLSLDEVVAATRIKKKFLEALETNNFKKIPSAVAARGFIKNYAEFLGLPSASVLSIFRRDFKFGQKKGTAVRELIPSLGRRGLSWSPKATLIAVVLLAFLSLLAYLGYQYFSLVKSPFLEIDRPQPNEQILTSKVAVTGKADPDSTVTVNGHLVSLSASGEFHFSLTGLPGENKIVVEATNRVSKKSRVERTVFVSIQKDRESGN